MKKQPKRKSSPRKKAVIKTKEKVERITIKSAKAQVNDLEFRYKVDRLATIELCDKLRKRINYSEDLVQKIAQNVKFWNRISVIVQILFLIAVAYSLLK